MNSFDLHMHSHYSSDGQFTPEELIQIAKASNLTTIALSDHNTPEGIKDAIFYGLKENIRVIPAMEFDTLFDDLEVHVLGYNLDTSDSYFQTIGAILKERKERVVRDRILKINEVYNVDLNPDELLRRFGKKNPFPQIVKAMVEDPRYRDRAEFQDYLPGGKRSEPQGVNFYWDNCSAGKPCYVRVEYPSLKETVERIHNAGGIAVIAHPWLNFYMNEERLQRAMDDGIDGIEAYSNYHEATHNEYYDAYCKAHNVLITCGSDFHGRTKPRIKMGEYGYTKNDGEDLLEAFLTAIERYKG